MTKHNKKLVDDVKVVLSDLDAVLDDIKGKTTREFAQMQESLSEKLMETKEKLIVSEQDLLNKEKIAAELTDSYTRNNAWKLIAVAAVLGFLIGYSL